MIPLLFLLTSLVLLNSSADVRVPLQVQVGAAGEPVGGSNTATTGTPAFDVTTIGGLIGLGSAMFYRWKKSDRHEKKFDERTTVGTQTIMSEAESLKNTDLGIADTLQSLSKAIALIPGVPPDTIKIIDNQLEAWKDDNKAYYEHNPAKPTDLSNDMVVKKLGEVQKITEKTVP